MLFTQFGEILIFLSHNYVFQVRNLRLAKKASRPELDCGERSAPVATKVISLIFPQFLQLVNVTELQIFIYRTRLYSGCLDQESPGLD
jgi:hypothetical protein